MIELIKTNVSIYSIKDKFILYRINRLRYFDILARKRDGFLILFNATHLIHYN